MSKERVTFTRITLETLVSASDKDARKRPYDYIFGNGRKFFEAKKESAVVVPVNDVLGFFTSFDNILITIINGLVTLGQTDNGFFVSYDNKKVTVKDRKIIGIMGIIDGIYTNYFTSYDGKLITKSNGLVSEIKFIN